MSSIFHRMAELVTVKDLLTPLAPNLDEDQPRDTAKELLRAEAKTKGYDAQERYSLVAHSGRFSHWLKYPQLLKSEKSTGYTAGWASEPIPATQVITAETSALHAAQSFGELQYDFFFVLESSALIGTLRYGDMSSAPFKLCLFALTLEIEETALGILLQDADKALGQLDENRRGAAAKTCGLRYPKRDQRSELLLNSTSLIDKGTMISGCGFLLDKAEEEIHDLFVKIDKVRNQCAHPGSSDEGLLFVSDKPKVSQLAEFIKTSLGLLADLEKLQT